MRLLRRMLIEPFWTAKELIPLYASLVAMIVPAWCLMWLAHRLFAPDWVTTVIVASVFVGWLAMIAKLGWRRIRDLREEGDSCA